MPKLYLKTLFTTSLIFLLGITVCYLFNNTKQMSPVFLVPYFSGAVNYHLPNNWLFVEEEVNRYKSLNQTERTHYDFKKDSAKATLYNYNYVGLVYIIIFANLLMPWLGDVMALEIFQVIAHIFLSVFILTLLKKTSHKVLFGVLYLCNPLVIYFVTFPYYYFWQVLASASLIPYLLNKQYKYNNWIFAVTPVLALSFLIRPTVIVTVIIFFALYFFWENKWKSICCLVIFSFLITTFSAKKTGNAQTYWHTIFIGMGAYPDSQLKSLSDAEGFLFFKEKTGKIITSTLPGGNLYTDDVIRSLYIETLKTEYIHILQTNPFLLIRNAALNFFQSFSLGYFVDYPLWISYISAFLGFTFCLLLLLKKQYLWIMAIASGTITFTPYFPPIQAYMFGSYILIVVAFIKTSNTLLDIKQYSSFYRVKFNKIVL